MELSLTGKRWQLGVHAPLTGPALVDALAEARGLKPEEGTSRGMLHDLKPATERMRAAIEKGERVALFGDYDCDGVTAVAQLLRFFRRHGVEPMVRLPHRVSDGYGLNTGIIDEFIAKGVGLLVTADTGIASVEEIKKAQAAGIDVIVTDHHHVPPELPPAFALVHPALTRGYPAPHPSGAGVVFRLLQAAEGNRWPDMETDAALAMIGTVADLVELRGENRVFVQDGLRALARLTQGPLHDLVEACGLHSARATSVDVAFRLAPRLNAAGRVASPDLALRALLEGGEALEMICELNAERQRQTEQWFEAATRDVGFDAANLSALPPLLASASEEYPHGIIGLIAGRLTEATGRPSIIATFDGEACVASLRSPPAYHITEGLERCADLLDRFGGHARAAGCTLRRDRWPELCERLRADIAARTQTADLQPSLDIDAVLDPRDVSLPLLESLRRLEPHGQGNPEPMFLLQNVRLESSRCVGQDQAHLQTRIGNLKAIGFRLGHMIDQCSEPLDVACRLALDSWQGQLQPQIIIADVRQAI